MEAYITNVAETKALIDLLRSMKNRCYASAALAMSAGTKQSFKIVTNPVAYTIDGAWYSKAAADPATSNACAKQADLTRCRYLITLNVGGDAITTKGTEVVSKTTGALATFSFDPMFRKIACESAAFVGFNAGDYINVSGATNAGNNGVFRIKTIDRSGYWVQIEENDLVTEAKGASITILRESALPNLPLDQCPIGIMTITTNGATYTAGTTLLDAAGITATFTNIASMPSGSVA